MNRFKPGDKARVIGNNNYHRFKHYQEVVIIEVAPHGYIASGSIYDGVMDCDLEPIEPVQEEESQKFFPLEFRLNNIGLLVGSVDIEYVVKYDQALQLAESTISRLKSEIEELKRKA